MSDPASRQVDGSRRLTASAVFVVAATSYAMAAIVVVHGLRPEDDPFSSPISQYAVGRFGLVMTMALLSWGISSWGLAAGLNRHLDAEAKSPVGLGLLIAFGVGLVVASIVPVDVPYDLRNLSRTGAIHVSAASISTLLFPFAALLLTRGYREDRHRLSFSRSSHRLALVILAVMPAVFLTASFWPQVFGLVQKIYALLVLIWMLATAWRMTAGSGIRT